MRKPCILCRLILPVFVLSFHFGQAPAQAMNLYSYDLDSLVYKSEHIVRGRFDYPVGTLGPPGNVFKVTAVFGGSLKVGDTVPVAAIDFFYKPGRDPFSAGEAVGKGDEAYAFLVRARPGFAFQVPADGSVLMPLPSGLKIVNDGRVCGFHQQSNPGPYVMDQPGRGSDCPTVAEFERDLQASMKAVSILAPHLFGPPAPSDRQWLLRLLRERVKPPAFGELDAISQTACGQLVNLNDFSALHEALPLVDYGCADILNRGFSSAEGRDDVLKRLSQAKLSTEQRERYASTLHDLASDYVWQTPPRGATRPAPTTAKSGRFFERIVELSLHFLKEGDDRGGAALLGVIHYAADQMGQLEPQGHVFLPEVKQDFATALERLKDAYPQMTSEALRFGVDAALLQAPRSLGFHASSGPAVSLVWIPGPDRHMATKPGHLTYEYKLLISRDESHGELSATLVLSDETGETFELPFNHAVGSGLSGGELVPLPQDLKPGRYKVFLRLHEGDRIVSDGHFVSVQLP